MPFGRRRTPGRPGWPVAGPRREKVASVWPDSVRPHAKRPRPPSGAESSRAQKKKKAPPRSAPDWGRQRRRFLRGGGGGGPIWAAEVEPNPSGRRGRPSRQARTRPSVRPSVRVGARQARTSRRVASCPERGAPETDLHPRSGPEGHWRPRVHAERKGRFSLSQSASLAQRRRRRIVRQQ